MVVDGFFSVGCWPHSVPQGFLMKPVNIHHILIFFSYIALKCQKFQFPKQPPLGVHAAPNFFEFLNAEQKKPWIQVIASYYALALV